MDFIDGLPRSGHADCIMIVVDKFSKFAHFIPLLHPYSAQKVAQVFLDSVFRLHGMPTHMTVYLRRKRKNDMKLSCHDYQLFMSHEIKCV